jgi:hypothetical protein
MPANIGSRMPMNSLVLAQAQSDGRAKAGDGRKTGGAAHRGNDAAERAGFASDARDESHVSLPSSVNGSAFEAGRIARVLGRLGQLLDVGLGIVEGDDGLALVETYVGLAHALNLESACLTVIGQRRSCRHGQRDGLGGGPHGGNNGSEGEGGKQFFHDELL